MIMSFKQSLRDNIWNILFFFGVTILAILIMILIIRLNQTESEKEDVIGAIFIGSVDDKGWNENHYAGLKSACEKYNLDLLIEENVNEEEGDCRRAVMNLASQGATAIFLTSDGFGSEVYEVVEELPEILFFTVSPESEPGNMISYYGRMYQMRYLSGIVAASMTETDMLGFVSAMDNPQVDRSINAFFLGARSVNEDVQVRVRVTGGWDKAQEETKAAEALIEEGCDILSYHTSTGNTMEVAEQNDIYCVGYNLLDKDCGNSCLVNLNFKWDLMYGYAIRDFLRGSTKNIERYWWGVTDGAVEIEYTSPNISDELKYSVESIKQSFPEGFDVFVGEIINSDGTVMCRSNERISDASLLFDMDWLVEGIEIDVE